MRYIYTTVLVLIWFNVQLSSQSFISKSFYIIQNAAIHTEFAAYRDITANAAYLPLLPKNVVLVETLPALYGLKDLQPVSASVGVRGDSTLAFGVSVFGIGGDKYSEYDFSINAGYRVENISLGAELSYLNQRVKNYNSSSCFSLNISALVILSDWMTAGVQLNNINSATFSDKSVELYREAVAGISFLADDWIYFSINSDILINNSWGLALESGVKPVENLTVKLAYLSNPKALSLGMDFNHKDYLGINLGAIYHADLGITPRAAVYVLW